MISKVFEVRDEGTFYALMATKLEGVTDKEKWLFERSGYDKNRSYIQVTELVDGESQRDRFKWKYQGRTLREAHKFIQENFDHLESGDVIDVAYILGITEEPKLSEYKGGN